MKPQPNALERNRKIALLVEQFLKLNVVGDAKFLRRFTLDDSLELVYLDHEETRRLAHALIVAEYQALRARGDDVSIESQAQTYCELFAQRKFELDRAELLKRLVQRELHCVPDSPLLTTGLDDLKRRFPEIADFFDQYFERRRNAVYSCSAARFPTNADESKAPPTVVSTSERYEVALTPVAPESGSALGKLGAGGLKDVYAARQASTDQTVALKILKHSESSEARRLFKSEALLQARLAHPNVPQIFTFDENGVAPTLVERLIPGKSWAELVDERSFDDNVATLATVSQIVAYAHERKRVLHLDLKPENVMLGESGGRYNEVYLVDWGLALCLDDEDATRQEIGGTIDYRPPETFAEVDLPVSCATDVFMLGGILYRLLTGVAPHQTCRVTYGENAAFEDAQRGVVSPIPEINPQTQTVNPPELIEIATKALRFDPAERYSDGGAFYDALERYRRRANLGERLRSAQEAFADLRSTVESASAAPAPSLARKLVAKLLNRPGAVDATRLLEATNEFRLLRQDAARSDADAQPSPLFWNAVASERDAYRFVCDSTLSSKDFGVARSLIDAAEALEATVRELERAPETPEAPVSNAVEVDAFRSRLARGLFRNAVQRCAVVGCVLALVAVLGVGLLAFKATADAANAKAETAQANEAKSQAEAAEANAKAETAQANAKTQIAEVQAQTAKAREFEQTLLPVAEQNWNQGEIALRSYLDTPELIASFNATQRHLAERSGIFLEAASSRRSIVVSIAFSADEKYFATFAENAATVYLAPNEADAANAENVAVAVFPFEEYDGERRLVANKAFVDATSEETALKSQFLLCRDDGVVYFLSFDATGATSTQKVDFRASEPQKGRAPWGTPRLATTASGETRLIVADAEGQASIYALADARLLKRFAVCKPVDAVVPVLIATPDGQTLFTAGLDGSFKRWSGDGEELETFDLPLSADVDLSLGALPRGLDVSPDGQTLYASDESGKFVVWDVAAKKAIYVGQEPANPTLCELVGVPATMNFISRVYRLDADRFLTLGFNDRWRLWDLANRDENGVPANVELRAADAEPARGLRAVDISPSRRLLATYVNSHRFEVYDVEERRPLLRSEGLLRNGPFFTSAVTAYLPQTDRVLVGTYAYRPLISFAPETLRVATEYDPYPNVKSAFVYEKNIVASSLAIPDVGDEFAAAFLSGDVFFFKDGVAEPTAKLESAFAKSDADGETLLFASSDVLNQVSAENLPIIAASPNGSKIVGKTALGDEFVLWDWKTRAEIKRWRAPKVANSSGRLALNFVANGTYGLDFINETEILEIKFDGSAVRYNAQTGERVATIPAPRFDVNASEPENTRLATYRLSNDRRRLALGFTDGLIAVVDLATERPVFTDDDFFKPLPKRRELADPTSFKGLGSTATYAAGFAWARDDSLLCATFGNGQAVILETLDFTRLETFVYGDAGLGLEGALLAEPYFTRDDKLITVDTNGFLKRWDFRPSPEKATTRDSRVGANELSGTSRPNLWARVRRLSSADYAFSLLDGDQEVYRRPRVETFQRLTEPNATKETFLILDKIGFLTALDETGAPVETDVDWNLNAPGATAEALELPRMLEEFRAKYPFEAPAEEFARLVDEIVARTPKSSVSPLESLDENDVAAQLAYMKAFEATHAVVGGGEIFEMEAPERLFGIAELGFVRVAVAPNRRAFAAIGKQDGALYVMTLAEADQGWRLVAKPEDVDDPFALLAFRGDSRELAASREDGYVTFVPFDAAPGAPDDVVWSQKSFLASNRGPLTNSSFGALAYSTSGKFLLQTGIGGSVWVWDAVSREITQSIELDLYERTLKDSRAVAALAPLRLNDEADAFVVAAYDGVLRFYRYDVATDAFDCCYLLSHTKLSDLIESAESIEERKSFSQASFQTADTANVYAQDEIAFEEDESTAAPANAIEAQLIAEELATAATANDGDEDLVFEEDTPEGATPADATLLDERPRNLFWSYAKYVDSLSVSDDQKTLYVGSADDVVSFDLDEIRRNIAALPEYWRAFDVESATGLRYTPSDGLQFINRDRLIPVATQP